MLLVSCSFYVRTQVAYGPVSYRYKPIWVASHVGNGTLTTEFPPELGEQIYLLDQDTNEAGEYRVVAKSWSHPQYGSMNWPLGLIRPEWGPSLQVVVERCEGVFANEEDDESDELEVDSAKEVATKEAGPNVERRYTDGYDLGHGTAGP